MTTETIYVNVFKTLLKVLDFELTQRFPYSRNADVRAAVRRVEWYFGKDDPTVVAFNQLPRYDRTRFELFRNHVRNRLVTHELTESST